MADFFAGAIKHGAVLVEPFTPGVALTTLPFLSTSIFTTTFPYSLQSCLNPCPEFFKVLPFKPYPEPEPLPEPEP
jgi:hypothetical protein